MIGWLLIAICIFCAILEYVALHEDYDYTNSDGLDYILWTILITIGKLL